MAVITARAFHGRNFTPFAFEKLPIDNTAGGVALTSGTYGAAKYAEISSDGGEVRFTVDGTPPTASLGHKAAEGDIIRLESPEDIAGFRAIRTGTQNGELNVTYKQIKNS